MSAMREPVATNEAEHPRQKPRKSTWQPPKVVKEKRLSCPVMEQGEVDKMTISMSDAATKEGLLNNLLSEYGMAIVTDVTCPRDTAILEELFKTDLEALGSASAHPSNPTSVQKAYERLKTEGPSAWPQHTLFNDKFSYKRGLEQGSYAWACRTHPNVKKAFEIIYGTEDLVCSMDAIFFNPKDPGHETSEDRYWAHADLNTHIRGGSDSCIQGILYTWSSEDPDASTTVIWPGSHKEVFDSLMSDSSAIESRSHFVTHLKVQDSAVRDSLLKGGHAKLQRVPVPAGSLLLWDSRTSHQGWAAGRRLAQPVCYQPTHLRFGDAYLRKLWITAAGLLSNHWATIGKVHTSQDKMIVEPLPAVDSERYDKIGLALNPSLVPFSIRPECLEEWRRIIPSLWKGTGTHSANVFKDAKLIENLLKPEILAVL
eukprot:TRINITY_DN5044_c0_g1_i1.p1 TRINITY_DN5044_c0_g1~~TRINITY_DN5044_c0_g1_i1.p1  ORF type:complete len:463 (+),score=65.01 TRINITY_DN5044_c0_g1_i1:110-1390(+)